jgi:O-antigen/teichoic acid export membrane protein
VASTEARTASVVAGICFSANLPFGVAQKIQLGYQEGFIANLWIALGSVLSLIALLVTIHFKGGLPWLALSLSGAPIISGALNCYILFFRSRPWLAPSWRGFDRHLARVLMGAGSLFVVLQGCALLGNGTDNLVIAHFVGVSGVALYAVIQRLFTFTQLTQYIVAPLWPAFGEALARNDIQWARKTLRRVVAAAIACGIFTAGPVALAAPWILRIWIKNTAPVPVNLLVGFAFWAILAGYGGVMSSFLNTGTLLRKQTYFYAIASVAAVTSKIVLCPYIGEAGAVWGTVFGYGVFYIVPAWRLAFKHSILAESVSGRAI